MTGLLVLEQLLNGLQFGLMLFLLAAGLTLVFGVMDMINLAHGSLYMVGAFLAAWLVALTGSFVVGVLGAVLLTGLFGMLLESGLLRSLYLRDHLSQVLATYALILILNDGVKMLFGNDLPLSAPDALAGSVRLLPGLRLVSAENAAEGLRLALQERPRLVLLDIQLPDMDGFEVLARLRASEASEAVSTGSTAARVPVVAVSANAMPADIEAAREAGFADYLTKPLDLERLHATVRRLLAPR